MQVDLNAACFHCAQPIAMGVDLSIVLNEQTHAVCCRGCQAVAESIISSGLSRYYQQRDLPALRPDHPEDLIPEALRQQWQQYDHPAIAKAFATGEAGEVRDAMLIMEGIVCAACVWLNERHINALSGVLSFHINYASHRAHLKWDDSVISLSEILHAIADIGYSAHPFESHRQNKQLQAARSQLLRQFAVATICSMQVMMLAIALYFGSAEGMSDDTRWFLRWVNLVFSIPCVTYSSWPFYVAAWRDIKRLQLNMDVNISLAISVGFIASCWNTWTGLGEVYFDSVTMFAFLLLGARLIEMNARHKALHIADAALKVLPASAHLIQDNGEIRVVAVAELSKGDTVLIKQGETIPADSQLITSHALVDEALLTGESLPIDKVQGDALVGGSVNLNQSITASVTAVGADSVLNQIVRLIDRAQSERPQLAQLANRVSAWFVSILLLACLASYGVWLWIDATHAFEVALAVLVVSCPCALALATPSALTAGAQAMMRCGLIATRSRALETLSQITHCVFDKTGTLTQGQLSVAGVLPINKVEGSAGEVNSILQLCAQLEYSANHPIARALCDSVDKVGRLVQASDVIHHTGLGVEGLINQTRYRLGQPDFVVAEPLTRPTGHTFKANTWIALSALQNGQWVAIAWIGLADQIRADAPQVLAYLQAQHIAVSLRSGDSQSSVDQLAHALGMTQAYGGQLPDDKLAAVASIQQQGGCVAMIGDGINDAPVLAGANVSIAMGHGAALAHAAADMILINNQLQTLADGIELAKKTLKVVKQNLWWALLYNVIALPIAACGWLTPWMAAIGMSASSLIVIGNTLRLRD